MIRKELDTEKQSTNIQKPVVTKRNTFSTVDRMGSKTAPIESALDFDFMDSEDENNLGDYISSYNYYIYYHSIKPRDPRLPKPTYKLAPDLDFIKGGFDKTLEEKENLSDKGSVGGGVAVSSSQSQNSSSEKMIYNIGDKETEREKEISKMMGKLEIKDSEGVNYGTNQTNEYMSTQGTEINERPLSSRQPEVQYTGKMKLSNLIQSPTGNYQKQTEKQGPSRFDQQQMYSGGISGGNIINPVSSSTSGTTNPFFPTKFLGGFYYNYPNMGGFGGEQGQGTHQSTGLTGLSNQQILQPPVSSNYNPGISSQYYDYMGMGSMGSYYPHNFPQPDNTYFPNTNQSLPSRQDDINSINSKVNVNTMGNVYTGTKQGDSISDLPQKQVNYPNPNPNQSNIMSYQQGKQTYSNRKSGYNVQPNMNNMNVGYQSKQGMNVSNYPSNTNTSLPDINEIITHIVDYCRDHSGSRIIQKKFEESNEDEKNKIMEALLPHIYSLSKDLFGNYVIQKILENSHLSKRKSQIMRELDGKIPELTLHMYGCRVIQKSIEIVEIEDAVRIFREIKHMIFKCIEDQNGNHVVQKLIEKLPRNDKIDIIRIVKAKCAEVAMHQYGCRVIQKIFENCEEVDYQPIMNELLSRALFLSQDQYGNYVIQHIVEKQPDNKIYYIWDQIRGKVFDLSSHKYASNVIEKLLTYGNYKIRIEILEEILSKDDQFSDCLLSMVRDKYGNYVVQKLIEVADPKTKENIVKRIITSQSLKKRDGFSKHVINFIEKLGLTYPNYR